MFNFCVMGALIEMWRHGVLCDCGKSGTVSGCVVFGSVSDGPSGPASSAQSEECLTCTTCWLAVRCFAFCSTVAL